MWLLMATWLDDGIVIMAKSRLDGDRLSKEISPIADSSSSSSFLLL